MHISEIEVWPFHATFRRGPYAMSHVTQSSIRGRLLKIKTDSGLAGIGEVSFHFSLNDAQIKARISVV